MSDIPNGDIHEAVLSFGGWVLCVRKQNTDEFMADLLERLKELAAMFGEDVPFVYKHGEYRRTDEENDE